MNKKFLTTIIVAGSIVMFSACEQTKPSEKKEARVPSTTGKTTSGSMQGTTSGQAQGEQMSSGMMNMMQDNMKQMKQMQMTGDPDYDFAKMMTMHHEAGMKMADEEINNGKNQNLVKMAQKMKQSQQMELKELKNYSSSKKAGAQNKAFMEEMNTTMSKGESKMSEMKMSGNMDQDFAMMMSEHNKNGIEMTKAEIKHGKDQKMKDMAKKIMENQKTEMKQLEEYKNKKQGM